METRFKRRIIILIFICLVCATVVVYAALSASLNINGVATIDSASWNIYFSNLNTINIGTGMSAYTYMDATTFNFNVEVNKPGDAVTYTFDVKNDGTIDAVLDSVNITAPSNLSSKDLEYAVTYSDGTSINKGDILNAKSSKKIKMYFKFKETATTVPSQDDVLNFGITLSYVQL